jgi:hypothetical protein
MCIVRICKLIIYAVYINLNIPTMKTNMKSLIITLLVSYSAMVASRLVIYGP